MSHISLKSLFFIVCVSFCVSVKGQTVLQVIDVADQLYNKGEYFGSIGFYEKAMKIDSSNREVLYKYGRNLSKINQDKKASRYLLKSSLLGGSEIFPMLNWELAQAYHKSGKYRNARRYYNRAIRPYRRDRESYWYKKIDQAKDASSWADKTEKQIDKSLELKNLGLKTNSNSADFSAKINSKNLYWTALISESNPTSYLINNDQYFSKIYTKPYQSSKTAEQINLSKELEKIIGNKHLANLTFGKLNTIYFSVCDTNYSCEIWKGELNGKDLTYAKKLNNNINYPAKNNSMPYWVSIEGKEYLFFVSNREKGFGGLDIWVSTQESFGFGEAVNLGANINTLGDEISPFYETKEKALYFSSDWHMGYGGFDIFKSLGTDMFFQNAINLGKPINSSQNDLYFFPFNQKALLTSDRTEGNVEGKSGCCNDIYELHFPIDPILDSALKDTAVQVVGVQKLNEYLPLELYFHNDSPDPNSRDSATSKNFLSLAYAYLKLENEYIDEFENYSNDDSELDSLGNFFDDKLPISIEKLEEFTPLLLKELQSGSKITLNIKGFASSLFNKEYNYTLTLRRIESLINYLKAYRNGVFIPYLNATALNGASLSIQKFPYGDLVNTKKQNENKKAAVYSYEAVKQRKIQLIAITKDEDGIKRLDNREAYQIPQIKVNTNKYDLGEIKQGTTATRYFLISNEGNTTLEIFNIVSNSKEVELKYPKQLKAGEKGRIKVEIPTQKLTLGERKIVLDLASNAKKNILTLQLKITVID